MVVTTDRHWASGITDNMAANNGLMYFLKKKGGIITSDFGGGYEMVERLSYAENSTYQRYEGYDELNTGASDVLTAAKFPVRQAALHVTASGREVRMNMGSPERMLDLVKERKDNAKQTAMNKFSEDLYSDGSATNQINGLANLIQTNGQGTVGGIDSATYTFWRNKFKEMTGTNLAATPNATNAASLKADMGSLWLSLTIGSDSPDLILASHDMYVLYETGEQQLQRYADSELAQSGFTTLKYKSANVIFDDNTNFATTAEKMYFLNTKYIRIKQHPEAKWTMDDAKTPVNQDAIVVPCYWMGNLTIKSRRLQGVLFDAA